MADAKNSRRWAHADTIKHNRYRNNNYSYLPLKTIT